MMEEFTERITKEEILKAFTETGLTPEPHWYLHNGNSCACGLGALYAWEEQQKGKSVKDLNDDPLLLNQMFITKYGAEYRSGFIAGFDGGDFDAVDLLYHPNMPQYARAMEGFKDGREAWNAVKHLSASKLLSSKEVTK